MADTDTPHADKVATLAKIVAGIRVAMVATMGEDGPVSRPMAKQEAEFDGDLWFFTRRGGRKVEQIGRDPRVNVSLSSRSAWVSIAGRAEVVDDPARMRELWNAGISAWFPDGPDDPDLVLLRVRAEGAEYWDSPGALVVSAISFVKSRLTGEPYRITDEKVSLA